VSRFAELPRARQLNLLWSLASGLSVAAAGDDDTARASFAAYVDSGRRQLPPVDAAARAAIAAYVDRAASRACPVPTWERSTVTLAALGNDGRWHPLDGAGERVVCDRRQVPDRVWLEQLEHDPGASSYRRPRLTEAVHHEQHCSALRLEADGSYRFGLMGDQPYTLHEHRARWVVRLAGPTMPAELVPYRERCCASFTTWPRYSLGQGRIAQLRRRLVDALGPTCQACGTRPGEVVDHDHLTWLVRGLVCAFCNGGVDRCPHVDGCRWADYLNRPPALTLGIRYPNGLGTSGSHRGESYRARRARFLELAELCGPCFDARQRGAEQLHLECAGAGCTCERCADGLALAAG